MDNVMAYMDQAIADTDEDAAAGRAAALREAHPDAAPSELIDMLIQQKCKKTGMVGAVTSGASMIPGLGTVTSLTFGVAADIGMTFKLQAELVLEIAAVYDRQLSPAEKQNAVMLVTGISAGANQLLGQAGKQVAQRATERLAQKSVLKAIPVLGVAASAGTNMLTTYIIGQRAKAYFDLGPEAVGDWAESTRALVGVDEREIIAWLTEAAEDSWELLSDGVHGAAGAVITVGKSAGELVVVSAGKAGQTIAGAGKSVAEAVGTAGEAATEVGKEIVDGVGVVAESAIDLGKKAGEGVVTGVSKAGRTVTSAGKSVVEGAGDLGKKTGEGVVTGVEKAGEAVADASKSVIEGAEEARKRVAGVLKGFKRGKKSKEPVAESDDE